MTPEEEARYGFRWGNIVVTRAASDKFGRVLTIKTDAGEEIEILISPKGRSVRAYDSKRRRHLVPV